MIFAIKLFERLTTAILMSVFDKISNLGIINTL